MNICSALVFSAPEHVDEVARELASHEGVEVHQTARDGRILITCEDTDAAKAIDALRHVTTLHGVIAASLVYHNFDHDHSGGCGPLELSQ